MTPTVRAILGLSFALNLLLGTLLALGQWQRSAQTSAEAVEAWHRGSYARRQGAFDASQLRQADVVFLGDSITHAGLWDEYFPDHVVANRGVSGDQTHHVLMRLDDVVRLRPAKLFLMIGVNDLNAGRPVPEVVANLDRILDRLATDLPETDLFVQGVLPVAAPYEPTNPRAREVNEHLAAACRERGCTYLDVGSLFTASDGTLAADASNDGLHLVGTAYAEWSAFLRPYVVGEP